MEKKGRTYQSNAKLEALSDEKRAKIKGYVKSYVRRLPAIKAGNSSRDPRRHQTANQELLSPGADHESIQPDRCESNGIQDMDSSDDDISDGSEVGGLDVDQAMENDFTNEQPSMEVDVF
jgi:hypothetical protein